MNLGDNIYRYRTQKGMSQGALADALDVSRQSVSKWENNNAVPELDKLIKMAELFDVSLDMLVGRPVSASPASVPESARPALPIRQILGIIMFVFTLFLFIYPYVFRISYAESMVPAYRQALLCTCVFLTASLLSYESTPVCWFCVGVWLLSGFLLLFGSDSRFLKYFFTLVTPVSSVWGILRAVQFYKKY